MLKPTLCLICSPSLALLDNWLPVLWKLRYARSQVGLLCILPRSRSVDEIDLSNVLISLASMVFDSVMFRSHAGNWLMTSTFQEAVELNRLGKVEAIAHRVAHRLRDWRVASVASDALRYGLQVAEGRAGARTGAIVHPRTVLTPVRAVLYDVSEETKDYNDDLMKHLDGVPRFSICHGIDIKPPARGRQEPQKTRPGKADVTAYLFSALERERYRDVFALTEPALKVVGIPRHEPDWMKTIAEQSSDAGAELGHGFIFVISKRVNGKNFTRERKRQALEDVRRLADDFGMKIVVKRHPKEHPDGLCEQVFGRDTCGDRWAYSNLHAFVLGARCAFAIAFRSSVVLDMIVLGTPVVERLDLRGIPRYDNQDALRDEHGEPVLSYRYWGLALGASEYAGLKRQAEQIINDHQHVLDRLASRYRELFPVVHNAAANIAQDVLNAADPGAAQVVP